MGIANWDQLVSEFTSLGGTVKNIGIGTGCYGRGLFPSNPKETILLFVPESILVSPDIVTLEHNNLVVDRNAKVEKSIKQFYAYYFEHFSWGVQGRELAEKLENGLKTLPAELKKALKDFTICDITHRHSGEWKSVLLRSYLNSRLVRFNKKPVFAPIWELINHSCDAMPIKSSKDGFTVSREKSTSAEILFQYGKTSPIKRFFTYGFTCNEPMVYSFSMKLNLWNGNSFVSLLIQGGIIKDDTFKTNKINGEIKIDGLPIFNAITYMQPYAYFVELLNRIGIKSDTRQAYSEILKYNIDARQKLLQMTNQCSSTEIIKTLIASIELELDALKSSAKFDYY